MSRTLFLLLLALFTALPALSAEPTAAVCAIRHQDQLLLVQDRISSRYSLSGGYIDGGERPEQAALRELYEETGLRGEVVADLGRWQKAQVFACRTRSLSSPSKIPILSRCCRLPIWAERSSTPA